MKHQPILPIMTKYYYISYRKHAVLEKTNTCPICGCEAVNSDTSTWDFVSNVYNRMPLLCGHGWLWCGASDPDDASAPWEDSIIIFKEFLPELEKLGYEELNDEEC